MKKKTYKKQGGIYLEEKTRFDLENQSQEEIEAAFKVADKEMQKPWEPDVRSVLVALQKNYTVKEQGISGRLLPIAIQAKTGLVALDKAKAEADPDKRLEYAFRAGAAYSKALALIAEDVAWEGRKWIEGRKNATGQGAKAKKLRAAMLNAWVAYLQYLEDYRKGRAFDAKPNGFFEWLCSKTEEGSPKAGKFGIRVATNKRGLFTKAWVQGEKPSTRGTIERKYLYSFRKDGVGNKPEGWNELAYSERRFSYHDAPLEIIGEDGKPVEICARDLAIEWYRRKDRSITL